MERPDTLTIGSGNLEFSASLVFFKVRVSVDIYSPFPYILTRFGAFVPSRIPSKEPRAHIVDTFCFFRYYISIKI